MALSGLRVLAVLGATLVLAACASDQSAGTSPAANPAPPSSPQATPASAQNSGEAQVVELGQVRQRVAGKPVLYLFTATGCASCAAEASQVEQAVQQHPQVQVVGVDVVPQDSPSALQAFLRAADVTSPRFIWTIDSQSALVKRFGVRNLDTTVGVDGAGQVRFVNAQPADAGQLGGQLPSLGSA